MNFHGDSKESICFPAIFNIFNPTTILGSFNHNGLGEIDGLKTKINNKFKWNTKPHKERIVLINDSTLRTINSIFDSNNVWYESKLPQINSLGILKALKLFVNQKNKIGDLQILISDLWNETTHVQNGLIKELDISEKNQDVIYNSPNFFVSNPFYKEPYSRVTHNSNYDNIDLMKIDEKYVISSRYKFKNSIEEGRKSAKGFTKEDSYLDYYKVGFSKMLSLNGERTLQPCILPRDISHTYSVMSISCKNLEDVLKISALTSSILYDFYIKTKGASNLSESLLKSIGVQINEKYRSFLYSRVLLLNCLTVKYKELWNAFFQEDFKSQSWSVLDNRLLNFASLENEWLIDKTLKNHFNRRLALIEIDVLTCINLGLNLNDLISIYKIQFPVLQQYEDDTWYDQRGNIIFTCSKGLNGVGIDRPEWEKISMEVNPLQRTLKSGDTYTHTITKSELYQGQQITYYPPFDKCDRVEDYRRAWEHFVNVFNQDN